ncbi:MAG: AAA domain-containing protein, partial [Fimbriimonadaceae bacterium]
MAKKPRSQKDPKSDLLSKKYQGLLGYIAELDRLRSVVAKTIDQHPDAISLDNLPNLPAIQWSPTDPSRFLVVTRCDVPASPPLPDEFEGWVDYIPNNVDVEPTHRESRICDDEVQNWDKDGPQETWDSWIEEWRRWASEARPLQRARSLYEKLYDLHAILQRAPDDVELVAADVMVAMESVDHPLLISPVQLNFDTQHLTISVGCREEPTQVYGDAIRTVVPDAGQAIAAARRDLEENPDIWAFGQEEVDDFARRFVQSARKDGVFGPDEVPRDRLSARRQRWLILRRRPSGLAELAEGLKVKFKEDGEIPFPIRPVLLDEEETRPSDGEFRGEPDEDEETFFTKPANKEQLAILRRYRRSKCVHVQGPPGTGKTHTIANLIGHFLAEGKSVLVTSEKAQALAVLRNKVVPELQPLCVSLVGSDAGEGLKAGMRGLYETLGSTEPFQLESDIERLTQARRKTIQNLRKARQTLRQIIESEHQPIEVWDWRGSPSDAGKYLHENRDHSAWINGTVESGSAPPLTEEQFEELLALVQQYPHQLAEEARKPIPPAEEVVSPKDFEELLETIRELESKAPGLADPRVEVLEKRRPAHDAVEVQLQILRKLCKEFDTFEPSYRDLASRVMETPNLGEIWSSLIREATALAQRREAVETDAAPFEFRIAKRRTDLLELAERVLKRINESGRPIRRPGLFDGDARALFESVEASRPLGEARVLQALVNLLQFKREYKEFRQRLWTAARPYGWSDLNEKEAERTLLRKAGLSRTLEWAQIDAGKVVEALEEFGLPYAPASLPDSSEVGLAHRLVRWLTEVAEPILAEFLRRQALQAAQEKLLNLKAKARSWTQKDSSETLLRVAQAILNEDWETYRDAYDELSVLRQKIEPVRRRDFLVEKLREKAKQFAASLSNGELEYKKIRGTLSEAWTFSQIEAELDRRDNLSLEKTKEDLDRLKQQLDRTTVELSSVRAWLAQHQRVTKPVQSALNRFHEAQRKIGRGKGKRVPDLLRAMRQAMREAKDAFPVWIMPLYDLTKSFDFTQTQFDVVIVDEASQLSAVGLITLLIAKSAIVVGDDEQTEPSMPGVSHDAVRSLIDEYLVDFPDRILWSPDSSLYSFAGRFGSTVGLREHFRCVPQIISFSSRLCYQGKIHPLREARGVVQAPHVVPVLCDRTSGQSKAEFNESEAVQIASLILACHELPEYSDQSFGV